MLHTAYWCGDNLSCKQLKLCSWMPPLHLSMQSGWHGHRQCKHAAPGDHKLAQLTGSSAVQTMVSDPDAVLLKLQNDFNDGKPIEVLTEGVREAIIKNVKRRMTPQPLKIRADVELTLLLIRWRATYTGRAPGPHSATLVLGMYRL